MSVIRSSLLAAGLAVAPIALLAGGSATPEDLSEGRVLVPAGEEVRATVAISYDPRSKQISVTPDPVSVERGQRVDWSPGSSIVAWAVDIASSKEPFGASVRANGVRGGKGVSAGARVRANATPDTYKYTVAVWDGQEIRILDPDIVVNN